MHQLLMKAGSCATALIAGAASVLGATSVAAADSTPQVSISIQNPATLIAHGAAIDVTMVASCSTAYATGVVTLTVTQTVGRRVASGQAFLSLDCVGAPQTLTATVYTYQVPFSKGGAALAEADLSACGYYMDCAGTTDLTTIDIR